MALKKAVLVLADGSVYSGFSFGYEGRASGELVFNTSMTGYQEVITDPSYAGQIVTFTYPHIGNTGINRDDMESARPFLAGVVVRDLPRHYSHWRATQSLESYLTGEKVVGIAGIDTRELTRRIRSMGAMPALISTEVDPVELLKSEAARLPLMTGQDLVQKVTCLEKFVYNIPSPVMGEGRGEESIVVIDYGAKRNILRSLAGLGLRVTVMPATASAAQVLAEKPRGVFLSNGPGDPAAIPYGVQTVRDLLGHVPIFGICLGHQILAQAIGGKTFKLKFGHRGINHPVKDLRTGKIAITSQNHGFAVDPDSLPKDAAVTHVSLYDGTVEGLASPAHRAFSVQYHPEAAAGPHDAGYLFTEFIGAIRAEANRPT